MIEKFPLADANDAFSNFPALLFLVVSSLTVGSRRDDEGYGAV